MIGPQDAEEPGEGEDPSPELLDGAIDRAAIDPHGRDVGILDRQGDDRQLTRIDLGNGALQQCVLCGRRGLRLNVGRAGADRQQDREIALLLVGTASRIRELVPDFLGDEDGTRSQLGDRFARGFERAEDVLVQSPTGHGATAHAPAVGHRAAPARVLRRSDQRVEAILVNPARPIPPSPRSKLRNASSETRARSLSAAMSNPASSRQVRRRLPSS